MGELLGFGETGWGDEILRGAAMTLAVAVLAYFIGIVVGFGIAGAKLSGSRIVRGAADGYTTVIRGVPELLVIYLLFFGMDPLIQAIAGAFGYGGTLRTDAFTVGTLSIALISGAYSAEVIRGAILAVPKGQIEAGRAFGMNRVMIFRRILLPQLLRLALPGLGNVWQLTLKDTALISVTGLAELMRLTSVAARSTREPFLFYLTAALLYLAMTTVSTIAFQRAERHYGRGAERA